jgi:hypothetical protein
MLYNSIWKHTLNDESKLKNIYNIQLLSSLLQNKFINQMKTADSKYVLDNIKDDMAIISKLHENVLGKTIGNMMELPQTWNREENYALWEIMEIIKHITKHILCANLYYAIVKLLTKYLLTINPKDLPEVYDPSTNAYNQYITKLVNKILNPNYNVAGKRPDAKLYNYIIEEMPEPLVKLKTKIYEEDFDKHKSITSSNTFFENITNLIINNGVITISKDSSLIKNLENYIFKYYDNVFDMIIPKMKVVVDNYNRFIMNENRYLKIAQLLNETVQKEMK